MIVSLVRSMARGKIGFLNEPQRVNVLLSRARDALILVGNPQCLMGKRGTSKATGDVMLLHGYAHSKDKVEMKEVLLEYDAEGGHSQRGQKRTWETVLQTIPTLPGFPAWCSKHSSGCALACPADFVKHAPDGGCALACEAELPCGHKCTSRCHTKRQPHASCHVPVDCKCDSHISAQRLSMSSVCRVCWFDCIHTQTVTSKADEARDAKKKKEKRRGGGTAAVRGTVSKDTDTIALL